MILLDQSREKFVLYVNLGSKNDGTCFQEECEVAGKVKTSSKPAARRNIELSTTLVSKWLDIENSILKGYRVQCFPISNCPKLQEWHAVRSGIQRLHVFTLSILSFSIILNSTTKCQKQNQSQLKNRKTEEIKVTGKFEMPRRHTIRKNWNVKIGCMYIVYQ